MKSLKFTLLKEKLISGEKDQTFRCLFVPNYDVGEVINIKFQDEILYQAIIKEIYPKQIKDLSFEEAKRDGFDSIQEMQDKVMELNKVKNLNRWGFVIQFKKILSIDTFL